MLMLATTDTKNAIVSIGKPSEEAAEARNTYFLRYPQNILRKTSKELCNKDVYKSTPIELRPLHKLFE